MNDEDIKIDILAYINSKPGGVSFYQVVRRFGLPGAQYDLPVLVEELVGSGYLTKENAEKEMYIITDSGRRLIEGGCRS